MRKRKKVLLSKNTYQDYHYEKKLDRLSIISGMPIAYWVSDALLVDFEKSAKLGKVCETRKGLATSDNNRFLRLWYEVEFDRMCLVCRSNEDTKIISAKWYPINKGGEYRKWYGNREYVINWEKDGFEIRNYKDENGKLLSRPQNTQYNFLQALTWSKIASSNFSARFCEGGGFLFDDAVAICHHKDKSELLYVLCFLNSSVCQKVLEILNPTLNIQIGDIGNLPIIGCSDETTNRIAEQNIEVVMLDWDSFETILCHRMHVWPLFP